VAARLKADCFESCRERARDAVKADPRVRAAIRALLEARQAQGGAAAAAALGGGGGGGAGPGGGAPVSASLRRQQVEALRRELQSALADPGSALSSAVSASAWEALAAQEDVDAQAHAALCASRRRKQRERERQGQQGQQQQQTRQRG